MTGTGQGGQGDADSPGGTVLVLQLLSSRLRSWTRNRADANLFPRASLLISPLHVYSMVYAADRPHCHTGRGEDIHPEKKLD